MMTVKMKDRCKTWVWRNNSLLVRSATTGNRHDIGPGNHLQSVNPPGFRFCIIDRCRKMEKR